MMESERIILRKWEMKDTYVLVENLNDSKMAYDLGTEYPYTFEMACKYIRDAIKYNKEKYAIVYKKNMKVIGGGVDCILWIKWFREICGSQKSIRG